MFLNYEYKKGAKLYIHKSSWTGKQHFFILVSCCFAGAQKRKQQLLTMAINSEKTKTFLSTSYKYVH